ncbi:minor capsid protein, partial [Bacillus paranthracis]
LVWNTPYARRLYYNPHYNFSKDENPYASGLWFELAKSRFISEWVALVEREYKNNL